MLKKLLEINDISKSYPGVVANKSINMNIKEGEIHAVSYTHLTLPTILLV